VIHRFSVENFYSIREEQVVDLALARTTPLMPRFRESPSRVDVRLPTVVALFGANASGKTNILRALSTTIDFAIDSFAGLHPDAAISIFQPFRSEGWWRRPTRIVTEFDAPWPAEDGYKLFRYELTIVHGPRPGERVGREVLSIQEGRRFRSLFRREGDDIRCATSLGVRPGDPRLLAVRRNASVIATLATFNHPLFLLIWEDIQETQRNIQGLAPTRYDARQALHYLNESSEARETFVRELRRLDLGLTDFNLQPGPNGLIATFTHEGLDAPVMLEEESEGTRHFLAMFPVLFFTLASGRPALIDEFDVGLHPLLVPEILRWFHDPLRNPNRAQLFVAAHNPAIMDHLEKEEVLLVEKGPDGASTVMPLRDFQGLRREPSLARKYLGGVFGAVPNVG
jgi:uncharacterized protein